MTKGIDIPVRTSNDGGSKTVEGSSQLKKLLGLAFGENDDENPFQNIGIDQEIIYRVASSNHAGEIRQIVNDIVSLFEGRIVLVPENAITLERNVEGQLDVTVRFFDPETDEEDEFRTKFTR